MNIIIGSDHAGFEYKEIIKNMLYDKNLTISDIGCYDNKKYDYPDIAKELCTKMNNNLYNFGILICGTGIGMSICANRYKHIRCALCYNDFTAKASRQHNNANILALGARVIDISTTQNIVNIFLNTKFEEGIHHKRINKINNW